MSEPVPANGADPCWAHHVAAVNGQRIHAVRAGQGDPVVLLHGWPQTWYMWRKIILRRRGLKTSLDWAGPAHPGSELETRRI